MWYTSDRVTKKTFAKLGGDANGEAIHCHASLQ